MTIHALAQTGDDRDQIADRVFQVGEPLPVVMAIEDMCRAFPVHGHPRSRSSFHRLERAGKFRKFELTGIAGDKCWSGAKVQRYLNGEPVDALRARGQQKTAI